MTDKTGKGARQEPPREKDARQDRLKLALRENLKRRKAQARARVKVTDASSIGHETSLTGEIGKRED